jgi:hypothetical protein
VDTVDGESLGGEKCDVEDRGWPMCTFVGDLDIGCVCCCENENWDGEVAVDMGDEGIRISSTILSSSSIFSSPSRTISSIPARDVALERLRAAWSPMYPLLKLDDGVRTVGVLQGA